MTPEQELLVMLVTNFPNFAFALVAVGVQAFVIVRLLQYMKSCDCPPRRETGEPYTSERTTTETYSSPPTTDKPG